MCHECTANNDQATRSFKGKGKAVSSSARSCTAAYAETHAQTRPAFRLQTLHRAATTCSCLPLNEALKK